MTLDGNFTMELNLLTFAGQVLLLITLFLIKHYFADWQFQTAYMVEGKRKENGYAVPLLSHAATHAALTFIIAAAWTRSIGFGIAVAIFDMVVHFIVDRLKAGPKYGGRFGSDTKMYWILLGLDQLAHQLTYVAIIYAIFWRELANVR